MRCIYAELLCETLNTYKSNVCYCLGDDNIVASIVDNLIKIISNFPTADVREVVRCNQCVHYTGLNKTGSLGRCNIHGLMSQEDYFCSWGERREDDETH